MFAALAIATNAVQAGSLEENGLTFAPVGAGSFANPGGRSVSSMSACCSRAVVRGAGAVVVDVPEAVVVIPEGEVTRSAAEVVGEPDVGPVVCGGATLPPEQAPTKRAAASSGGARRVVVTGGGFLPIGLSLVGLPPNVDVRMTGTRKAPPRPVGWSGA